MTPETPDTYELALDTGDRYTAQLAAALNGLAEGTGGEAASDLVVEEPDF